MKLYRKINLTTGMFIEDILLDENEEIPVDCIETPCPQGLYRPKWNGTEWVEGLTQSEIDAILGNISPPPLTIEELAENVNSALLAVMELSLE